MSPLWRHERVLIGLSPERLSALLISGFPRARLIDRHVMPLKNQDAGEWDKDIDAIDALLDEPAWRGHRTIVVLSGHYVRHAMFPPAQRDIGDAARQALADAVFRETFGDLARDWELRVSPAAPDRRTLACGVPRALLAALRNVCDGRGRLESIQPCLMPVFNHVRGEMEQSVGCLAVVEPGRITLAFIQNGEWIYVDSRAADGSLLPQLLLEESTLSQRQPGGILWLCDLSGMALLPAESFWSHKSIVPPTLPGIEPIPSLAVWGLA